MRHEDYLRFIARTTGITTEPLARGVLTQWDRIRVIHGAIDTREARHLAHDVAGFLRQEYPELLGRERS